MICVKIMEMLSHILWTNLVFKELPIEQRGVAIAFGVLPDLITFSALVVRDYVKKFASWRGVPITFRNMASRILHHKGIPSQRFPGYSHVIYKYSHSLPLWALVTIILYLLGLEWWALVFCAWGFHLFLDIFSHSEESIFITRAFWPISNYQFPGIKWHDKKFVIANYLILAILYAVMYL